VAEIDPKDVARRLRALMAHLDMQRVQDLAASIGAERSAVSNWLNGYNLPPVALMAKIISIEPGITLDWLYRGEAGALPVKLAIRLGALESLVAVPEVAEEPSSPKAPGRGGAQKRQRPSRSAT
jgi:transcriptional regulator with XRE-family HTH domain